MILRTARDVVALMLAVAIGSTPATAGTLGASAMRIAEQIEARANCSDERPIRVGIWPFDESEIPIAAAGAARIYAEFLSVLIDSSADCVEYLDGDGVATTIESLSRTGAFREAGRVPLDRIETNLREVDYFVAGTILEQAGRAFSVFKLTDSKSGVTLTRTPPVDIPQARVGAACSDGAAPMQAALEEMASTLANRAHRLEHLVLEGGYYRNTDAKTEFSQYFEQLIVAHLTAATENILSDRMITVENMQTYDITGSSRFRGMEVGASEFRDYAVTRSLSKAPTERDPQSIFRLLFRYWPCGNSVRMVVGLHSLGGEKVSWLGNIRIDAVPEGIALEPGSPTVVRQWGPAGAFGFQLTSERGRHPTYQPGEHLRVLFRLDRDAWLYCFYRDSSGVVTQVMPNPFQRHHVRANFYRGGQAHLFPDPERKPEPDPFDLVIGAETTGVEEFQCFASTRDITDDLPVTLKGISLEALPPRHAERLHLPFETLEDTAIAAAKMTLTVLE